MQRKLHTHKLLVIGLGLVLAALALAACQPSAPTAAPATTNVPVADKATEVPQPTAAPTEAAPAPTTAPAAKPSPTPIPFTATVNMLAVYPRQGVMVNLADDATKQAKLFTGGLNVVPPGVPQYVAAGAFGVAKDAKLASYEWKIAGPDGSKATIAEAPADEKTGIPAGAAVFTPDVTGEYTITLVVKDDAGSTSVPAEYKVTVATYIGSDKCKGCHSEQYAKWETTGHGTFFKVQMDEDPEGEYKEAGFGCARCHTAGYYPIATASTGGFWDVAVNVLKWAWPTESVGKAGTFDAMPAELKSLANINCENCHGPGSEHNGDPTKIATSTDSGVCNQCHDDGHFHIRGEQFANSGHLANAENTHAAGRAECASCHSPQGFIDTLNGVAADKVNTDGGELGCATCHDPHDSTNFAQLRVVGAVKVGTLDVADAGLSAVCMECHRANADPATIETDKPSFPHYSSSAEALTGTGGYDFGVKLPNSPHFQAIGNAPAKDAQGNELYDGNKPGSCVSCHMATTPGGDADAKEVDGKSVEVDDPGHNQVGSHSFNMTSPDGAIDNVATCQSCHSGITSFNFTAKADYDGNGKVEGVQDEMKGLLATLKEAIVAKGVKATDSYPYFANPENPSVELKGAEYNYRLVMGVIPTGEGRGWTAHNFQRAAALLQVSYAKLTGQDIPNATILYTK